MTRTCNILLPAGVGSYWEFLMVLCTYVLYEVPFTRVTNAGEKFSSDSFGYIGEFITNGVPVVASLLEPFCTRIQNIWLDCRWS